MRVSNGTIQSTAVQWAVATRAADQQAVPPAPAAPAKGRARANIVHKATASLSAEDIAEGLYDSPEFVEALARRLIAGRDV